MTIFRTTIDLRPRKVRKVKFVYADAPFASQWQFLPLGILAFSILSLLFLFVAFLESSTQSPNEMEATSLQQWRDQYGGVGPRIGAVTGHFRIEKIGGRWLFVTPAGNAFFMVGVYDVSPSHNVDDLGGSYYQRVIQKYGDADVGPSDEQETPILGLQCPGNWRCQVDLARNHQSKMACSAAAGENAFRQHGLAFPLFTLQFKPLGSGARKGHVLRHAALLLGLG